MSGHILVERSCFRAFQSQDLTSARSCAPVARREAVHFFIQFVKAKMSVCVCVAAVVLSDRRAFVTVSEYVLYAYVSVVAVSINILASSRFMYVVLVETQLSF